MFIVDRKITKLLVSSWAVERTVQAGTKVNSGPPLTRIRESVNFLKRV